MSCLNPLRSSRSFLNSSNELVTKSSVFVNIFLILGLFRQNICRLFAVKNITALLPGRIFRAAAGRGRGILNTLSVKQLAA